MDNSVYMLALGSNLFFALGSIIYTKYARLISSVWMNTFKASFALMCFALTITLLGQWHALEVSFFIPLLISGAIGLGIGDIFILKSFASIGPGRTMMLFGFQPLIIGALSYLFFQQTLDLNKFWAIIFFIACLITFSLENLRTSGQWDFKGIVWALTGMLLDALGIILTRYSFNQNPSITSWEGNFYRCLGAIAVFLMISYFRPFNFFNILKELPKNCKLSLSLGSLLGTYCSLSLYLMAIQMGNLATISGLSITGTLFAAFFECLYFKRKPSKYLILGLCFFLFGMKFLLF